MKFWSEVPSARAREMVADFATWGWVALWVVVADRLYTTIAAFAAIGRSLSEGGLHIEQAGDQLGGTLSGVPFIGEQARGLAVSAFGTAGQPFVYVGDQLQQLILLLAALLAIVVLAVTLVPWLFRYVPWRAKRLARLRAAHRAIRVAPRDVSSSAVERLLASRALHRLTYGELLAASPDPFGDFASGRFDRLARAELASVGLRP